MSTEPSRAPSGSPMRARLIRWAVGLIIIAAVGALVWSQLPRGPYSTDLGRVGQGRPAVVLAYDIQSMGGMEVMAMMDDLRPQYEDRVEFLVAPLGAPQGQAFGQRHDAVNGTLVFFSPAGSVWRQVHLPADGAELRRLIDGLLAAPR